MMISRKCPCCGKDISILKYINREYSDEVKEDEIVCKYCNQSIIAKNTGKSNPGTLVFLFLIFIFYLSGGLFTNPATIVTYIAIAGSISYYIQFLYHPLKCSRDAEEQVAISSKTTMLIIVITAILFLAFIFLSFFSFALNQKSKEIKNSIEHNVSR